jgi:hypothetical protein
MRSKLESNEVLISVNQAAQIIGCTTGRVRQLLLSKSLPGKKVTKTSWVLAKSDVTEYAKQNPRKPGRKRVSEVR